MNLNQTLINTIPNINSLRANSPLKLHGGNSSSPISFEQAKGDSMQIELLTQQERKVIDLILEGLTNAEIAEQLCVADVTIRTHINNILKKLKMKSRCQIMAEVIRELNFRIARLVNEKYKEEI